MIVPTTPAGLADAVTELVLARAERSLSERADNTGRTRVVLDGPPPSCPESLAAEIAERLRTAGRAALVVLAADFLRPASVRLEYGREDPDELLDGWLDDAALRREVLDPAAGSGRVLPRLWNPATDRAYRADYAELPPDGVVLLAGALLLGRGLPVDVAVHLHMSPAALARRLPPEEHWTLPAHDRYERERDPDESADLVALTDHPARPAIGRPAR